MVPVNKKRLYVKEVRKKPHTDRTAFWVIILLAIGIFSVAWWLWSCLFNVSPQFNFILFKKNEHPLKLLNGETLNIHPKDRLRISKISTNICFNHGVRLVAMGFDVNAVLYEGMAFSTLLPNKDIFNQYKFRVKVKRYNQDMGYVDIVVEPHLEDWLDKAERTLDRTRKVAILEQTLKMAPKDNRITDRLIEEYKSLKKWPQVARMLEKMAKEKSDQKVLYDLLEVYEAIPKTDGIISVLRRLVEQDPDDMEVRLRLASALEKSGKLKGAIKEYEELLKGMEKEDRLPVYKVLGYLYTKTDQSKKAISSYLHAVELDEKDVNIYYNLSILHEKIGQKEKADLFLSKAVSFNFEDIESRMKLAERLIKKEKLEDAEKYLKEILKKNPDSVRALLLMIKILESREDKNELKKVYHKILSIDPKNETIIYNLGVLEYETGNLAKSLSYFTQFVKLHPEDTEVHGFLFDIYRQQKKGKLALKEARTLIKLRPKETSYYHYIFEYLNGRGDYKKMIEIMEDGLKSHPENNDLREYLVLAYLKTGKEDLAIAQMKKVLKTRPKDATLLLQLAKLEEKRGKLKAALQAYQKILDISPGNEEVEEAYLRLRLKVLPLGKKKE
ncbi:MAG: tetratricopeptide repeat protein [Deltaproteobacteria bacterium]|nr:tetratricopeptide repeat protein [Deltaproteobacteria bacterium]